jgi:hypothetical protein
VVGGGEMGSPDAILTPGDALEAVATLSWARPAPPH